MVRELLNANEPLQRPTAATAINHRWIQGTIPKIVSDQTDNIIKEIQRLKKNYPQDIVKRLGLRAVAYCYVLEAGGLDKILLTFFHYLDHLHNGSINADGLQALLPDYPIKETEGNLNVNRNRNY